MDEKKDDYPFMAFSKIQNFKNAKNDFLVQCHKDGIDVEPIHLTGTVKLHGTHGDVVRFKDGIINIQSRNRLLSPEDDNIGFASFVTKSEVAFRALFDKIQYSHSDEVMDIMISGEWCGGKIQPNVALCRLLPMFVIFGIKIQGKWQNVESFEGIFNEVASIYNIYQFPRYETTIENLEDSSLDEVQMMTYTNEVERECPVGKYFGVSGIGEGIVWMGHHKDNLFQFKTKGELMSHVKSTKQDKISLSIEDITSLDDRVCIINAFVDKHVSESRLNQGIDYLREFNLEIKKQNTNTFRKWIETDIISEEATELESLGLSNEDLGLLTKRMNNLSSSWFVRKTSV